MLMILTSGLLVSASLILNGEITSGTLLTYTGNNPMVVGKTNVGTSVLHESLGKYFNIMAVQFTI